MHVDVSVGMARGEVQPRTGPAERERVEPCVQPSVDEPSRRLPDIRGDPHRLSSTAPQDERERESGGVVGDELVAGPPHGGHVCESAPGGVRLEQRSAAATDEDDRLPDRAAPRRSRGIELCRRASRSTPERLDLEPREQRAVPARTPGEGPRIADKEQAREPSAPGLERPSAPVGDERHRGSGPNSRVVQRAGSARPDASSGPAGSASWSRSEQPVSVSTRPSAQALPLMSEIMPCTRELHARHSQRRVASRSVLEPGRRVGEKGTKQSDK